MSLISFSSKPLIPPADVPSWISILYNLKEKKEGGVLSNLLFEGQNCGHYCTDGRNTEEMAMENGEACQNGRAPQRTTYATIHTSSIYNKWYRLPRQLLNLHAETHKLETDLTCSRSPQVRFGIFRWASANSRTRRFKTLPPFPCMCPKLLFTPSESLLSI